MGYQQCYATLPLFFITYYFKTKMRAMWDPITLSLPLELTEYLDRQPVDPLEDRFDFFSEPFCTVNYPQPFFMFSALCSLLNLQAARGRKVCAAPSESSSTCVP